MISPKVMSEVYSTTQSLIYRIAQQTQLFAGYGNLIFLFTLLYVSMFKPEFVSTHFVHFAPCMNCVTKTPRHSRNRNPGLSTPLLHPATSPRHHAAAFLSSWPPRRWSCTRLSSGFVVVVLKTLDYCFDEDMSPVI